MSQNILNVAADFSQALNAQVVAGDTTAALDSIEDSAGNNLANGYWGFTIDGDNQYKEYIVCTLTGTALTAVMSVSPQGVATSGFSNYHRKGASVVITDWAALYRVVSVLNGTLQLDGGIPLSYDSTPALGSSNQLATVQYVLDHVSGGSVAFNAEVIAGMAGETITTGQWVYLKESDGRWYKTDASNTAKCINVRIGKALGAGTAGNAIAGGVFLQGLETSGTYASAFTVYYLSDTPGAVSTSAGTNTVIAGFADGNSKLIVGLYKGSTLQALTAGGALGTPSNTNKFQTETGVLAAIVAGAKPIIRTYLNAASPATWTKPAGLKYLQVELVGGGGGSGGCGSTNSAAGGGGAGGYSKKVIATASLGATETVTIGAGGTAGSANGGTPGGNGGTSSFGTHLQATGGTGASGDGNTAVQTAGGPGGVGSLGDVNLQGQDGGTGLAAAATNAAASGYGGSSLLGGGPCGVVANNIGTAGTGLGSGASGGATNSATDRAGAAGAGGLVIVTEYYS